MVKVKLNSPFERLQGMSIRKRVYEIIQPDQGNSVYSRVFDWVITTLILISVLSVFAVTFDLPKPILRVLFVVEEIASIVFSVEYLLRIVTSDYLYPDEGWLKARLKYVISPMALVDLVAVLPFWLPMLLPCSMLALRALRLVRLLRIFKLNRYFDALKSVGAVLSKKRRELLGSLFFVVLLMLVASLLMYSVEHDAQPEVFRNAFSGLWWAVATLTTVGYGDIYPVTGLGRFLGAVIAFTGIAALAVPTGIVTAGLSEKIERDAELAERLERLHGKDAEHDGELERQRGKDVEHDGELERLRGKDADHDRILLEQGEMLKEISVQIAALREELHGAKFQK